MNFMQTTTDPDRPRRARALPWVSAGAVLTLTLGLAACASDDTTSDSTTSSTSDAETTGGSDIVALAEAFAATLSDDQQTELYQDYTLENASNWSNLPNGGGPSGERVGVSTGDLSDEQFAALETLLVAATGSAVNEGYDEILQHLAADDYLASLGEDEVYGSDNFAVAFLGTPSDSGTWQFQFGGHHLAVSNTYTDGVLAGATPSFRGIEPMPEFEQDGVTVMPELQEQAAFVAFLASLTSEQLATATTSDSYTDILLGAGEDWAFPTTSEGLQGSELSDEQKALLLAAINTYVNDVTDADAATILEGYESDLDDTYFLFSGSSALDMESAGDYVRIDGPSVWIEYSTQTAVTVGGTHPHAVWRDRVTDYGGLTS